MNNPGSSSSKRVHDRTERLNKSCFCATLDLPSLREAMEREAGDPAFFETFIRPKAHLFSHVPVFLLDLHRFCSGHVLMLGGPLFEGHW